jgi:hypothetical protein
MLLLPQHYLDDIILLFHLIEDLQNNIHVCYKGKRMDVTTSYIYIGVLFIGLKFNMVQLLKVESTRVMLL